MILAGKVMNPKLNYSMIIIGILDFSKAFDKVPHARLLLKMDFYGIRSIILLLWIRSFYVLAHNMCMVVEGIVSSPSEVTSSVPQDQCLDPLFSYYIAHNIDILAYTDYTLIPPLDDSILQEDLLTKGSRTIAANYRPISLTSICCKILEHVIHPFIFLYNDRNNILCDHQHGFYLITAVRPNLLL